MEQRIKAGQRWRDALSGDTVDVLYVHNGYAWIIFDNKSPVTVKTEYIRGHYTLIPKLQHYEE